MLKDKKVIVTGGTGFIGSHIVNRLLSEGADVHIIDNFAEGKKKIVPKGVTLHKKDIRKLKDIHKIFKDANYVFHLAALPRVQFSIEHPIETFEVNLLGTLNVLEASRLMKVQRVVYSASSSAYGDQPKMPLTEDMPAMPKSPYGLQKYQSELLCKMYSEIYDLSTVNLRYFNVYGPGLDPDGAYALVIGKFLKQRSEGKPMTITGDGKQTRDFTHVNDVANANVLAATGDKVGKGESINIGSGRNVSLNKLAEIIGGPIEYIPARLEPKDTLADNSKAKELLGWSPTVSFEDGMAELKKIWKI